MTTPGDSGPLLAALPREPEAVVAVAQDRVVHEFLTEVYGFALSPEHLATVHVRPVSELLERIASEDRRPLTVSREPARRLASNCRHFTVLAITTLQAQGTPARARCGFGGYFGSGAFEDHWVCEYWNSSARRWILADAQIDDVQHKLFDIDFDVMDVPRPRFMVAGDAWRLCRQGAADPAKFGLSVINQGGDWWITSNLLRDVAALTRDPGLSFAELATRYAEDNPSCPPHRLQRGAEPRRRAGHVRRS